MMPTALPAFSPMPMRPAATWATSSPKVRAETSCQLPDRGDLRATSGLSPLRAMRSASSHGTDQCASGWKGISVPETPLAMWPGYLGDLVLLLWDEGARELTCSLCQAG